MGKGSDGAAVPPGSGMSPKEESKQIQQAKLKASEMRAGDKYFVVASAWYSSWAAYTNDPDENGEKPAAIDNTVILIPKSDVIKPTNDKPVEGFEPQVKAGLAETTDYVLVAEAEWNLLVSWYGGGPVIERFAISEGAEGREVTRVEVFLQEFELIVAKSDGFPDMSSSRWVYITKRAKLRDLVKLTAEVFKLRENFVRIWDWEDEKDLYAVDARLLSDLDPTIEACGLIHRQRILVEGTKRPGVWPRDDEAYVRAKYSDPSAAKPTKPSNTSSGFITIFGACFGKSKSSKSSSPATTAAAANHTDGDSGQVTYGSDAYAALVARSQSSAFTPGLCGLRNLGNTCFMNSALQCLSNTSVLRNYFLEGRFKGEINEKNTFGMQGNLAKQFSLLLRSLWSGENSFVTPKAFKQTLGKWAPQFEGFNQHDAHELLAFLLDGLHEDLNRIAGKKPYVEVKEGHGRPDKEVAEEAWSGHLRRNSSVIVDLFHGQLKSTVTCPDCQHVSVTFDPFMYLSLPLQQESSRYIEISFWLFKQFHRATKYAIKVPRGGSVADGRSELARLVGVPAKNILIAQMQESRLVRILQDQEDTATFAYGVPYMAYEFPQGAKPFDKRRTTVAFMIHRLRKGKKNPAYTTGYGHQWAFALHGLPFLLEVVKGQTTGRDIYQAVWNKSSRYLAYTNPDDDDENEDANEEDAEEDQDNSDESAEGDEDAAAPSTDASATAPDSGQPSKTGNAKEKPAAESGTPDDRTSDTSTSTPNGKTSSKPKTPKEKQARSPKPVNHYLDSYEDATYPFKIVWTTPNGTSCSICGNICDGCVLQPNDEIIYLPPSAKSTTFSIEWPSQIQEHYYNKSEACGVSVHDSLTAARDETKKAENNLGLRDCLNMYTTEERLSENDPWYCPTCKTHRCAWKKLDLWNLPEILVIHLKRFHFSHTHRNKLNWQVDFPTRSLNLDDFVINPSAKGVKYDLFAVANHMGGLSSGHYTASAKCDVTDKWYTFDDSNVSPAKEKQVANPNAYVLFYRRCSAEEAARREVEGVVELTPDGSTSTTANKTQEQPKKRKKHNKKGSSSTTSQTPTQTGSQASTPAPSPVPTPTPTPAPTTDTPASASDTASAATGTSGTNTPTKTKRSKKTPNGSADSAPSKSHKPKPSKPNSNSGSDDHDGLLQSASAKEASKNSSD